MYAYAIQVSLSSRLLDAFLETIVWTQYKYD